MSTPTKAPPAQAPTALLTRLAESLTGLTPRAQVNALLDRQDLPAVLARLPLQDLFNLIREVGVADCLELLEQAPAPVIQGLCDLGLWRAERLDPRQLAAFLAALLHQDADGALTKLLSMDLELLTLFIKLHTRVIDLRAEEPVPDDATDVITTPDNTFAVMLMDPPGLPEEAHDPMGLGERGRSVARQAVRELLNALMRHDPALCTRLLDATRYELPSQLEEDALRWRNARLMDLGFPTREEALATLSDLDPDTPAERLKPPQAIPAPAPEEPTGDLALARFVNPDDGVPEPFLRQGLAGLGEAERANARRELVLLCNRVAVARGHASSEPDATRLCVRETRTTVDLGLSYRCAGNPARATEVMTSVGLTDLFRVGQGLGLRLQREARKLLQGVGVGARELAELLDPPGGMVVAALMGRVPMYYTGLSNPGSAALRVPASLDEVAAMARSLKESGFRLAVGLLVLGVAPGRLSAPELAGTNLSNARLITVEVLLTTVLARAAAGGTLADTAPLTPATLEAARRALGTAEGVRRAGEELAARVAGKAPLPGALTAEEARTRAHALASVLLTRLDEEIRAVPGDQPLDGRFITRALVTLSRPA